MEMPVDLSKPFDVAIVGGGPAGTTAAAFLAQRGRRVALFEKDRHPRFHIGESLLPKNLPILDRLGVADEVAAIGILKPGAELISPDHEARQVFRFSEALDPWPSHAYQVERARFDEILWRNARAKGAFVKQDCAVTGIEFESAGCRLTLNENGHSSTCQARFLIDASGRDGVVARHLGSRQRNRIHNSAAMFAHFEGVPPAAWTTQGDILIFWFEHGWMWLIPLQGGRTSVGAVCMTDYLKTRAGPLDAFFVETLRLCPKVWDAVKPARRVTPVHGAGNYSYKAERAYGQDYLLLGDAYAFVDPVFSSGVFIAMSSAEMAAEIIDQCLERPNRAKALLRAHQRRVDLMIDRFSWLIYRFNAPALRGLFMRPREKLRLRGAIISLVAGDVAAPGLAWRLAVFKVIFAVLGLAEFRRARAWARRSKQMRAISMPETEVTERL